MTHAILLGNPNCGKTTLFNALTGANQKIGNWPGVTVAKKTGTLLWEENSCYITDLPGIYSVTNLAQEISQDEKISIEIIASTNFDLIINVIDACHLERHLYLTSQIIELGKPTIIVLNMIDLAKQRGININYEALAKHFNCPVLPVQAHKKIGMLELKETIVKNDKIPKQLALKLPANITNTFEEYKRHLLTQQVPKRLAHYFSYRFLEGDLLLKQKYKIGSSVILPTSTDSSTQLLSAMPAAHTKDLDTQKQEDWDIILADARYQAIHEITSAVQSKNSDVKEFITAKIDRIVLHRFWALPIFLAIMYLMFLFSINIGGAFQDFFDLSSEVIFVKGSEYILHQIAAPNWLVALIAHGIGRGINTVVTFIPVIAALFFFLSILEISGYMARAAFVVDKIMRALGLPGKAFIPMIIGFGCNVPAIMSARTLDSTRDRILTVMISPFMSCSARLAIYTVFVAAFFPSGGQNIVFSLYLIGILMAVFTGFILRKTVIGGESSPLILELPAYHKPTIRRLITETNTRLRYFIMRAGKLIIPICILLGGLNAINVGNEITPNQSLLAAFGIWLTPIFTPMGITPDNWPATVGLLTGMLAKEVVVGTLNSLYSQLITLAPIDAEIVNFSLLNSLKAAFLSIPENFAQLGYAFLNPIAASAGDSSMSQPVYGEMMKHFDGKIGAYAYLLFVLLYVPCVSTMAAIKQEVNNKWMWFSIFWSCLIAYFVAVLFYQCATFNLHPIQSLGFLLGILLCISFIIWALAFLKNDANLVMNHK